MSQAIQAKQGVAFLDSIIYQKTDGTFQTGKVQGDFTLRLSKNGVGNQSTTGITITEVDSVNNPGEYYIAIASTAFVAAVGEYTLLIFDTATPTYSWSQVYQVTALGQVGSVAPVAFEAAASDGRAVDSSNNPLQDVTIYVTNDASPSISTYFTVLTTDADGLFTFYADPGTYTLRYEKSGYELATTTVTFTTLAATGPGEDVTMGTAAASSGMTLAALQAYARQQAYDETGTQADAKLIRAVNNAIDMVARDTQSNWWLRRSYLSFYGAQDFTCTLTNGSPTVTIATGTFPSWSSNAKLKIGSQVVDIIANPATDTLTLATDWNQDSDDYACVLFQDSYSLPTNCYQFGRILPGQSWGWGGEPVSAERLWEAQNASTFGQTYPSAFAVAYSKLLVFPYPTTDKTVAFTYHARPTPMTSSSDVADFDPSQIGLIYSAINYQVSLEFGKALAGGENGGPEKCLAQYRDNLGRSIGTDRLPADLPSLGRGGFPTARDMPIWKTYRSP